MSEDKEKSQSIRRAKPHKFRRDRSHREAKVGRETHLKKATKDHYDVIVIGSGLGGMTSANCMARQGRSVLLLEQHYILGGLAQYFKRAGHVFDISLHGFPIGMKKTLRKYWSKELADNIHQVKSVRFDNPQFTIDTTFTRDDFTRILVEEFNIEREQVIAFYDHLARMNYYDQDNSTTRDLFQKYFPDRSDVWRLLMEPITYANGSTLDEPAISYGIVFSNFMSKGVYIYHGGTDDMIDKMEVIMNDNGIDICTSALVQKITTEDGKVTGVTVNGKTFSCDCVISNAGIHPTINRLVGRENFSPEFVQQLDDVKVNTSSTQVYLGIRKGESIPFFGDLVFTSTHPEYDADALVDMNITSRTFSVYYPEIRPDRDNRYTIVASMNARFDDWNDLSDEEYQKAKDKMIDDTITVLDKYVPGIREKIDYAEAGTPRTVEFYTLSEKGTSFGTKFEGLEISSQMPQEIKGLYHAGSVGIIMSGWLGAANYGVIVSNQADKFLHGLSK
ncbi:FAD-dependent oxidoreductase [Lentisphaera profundi]|uniref:FAD-dependent oxidoreductase n=1 Tax=Lentisphaera profundi TaxID=1658616 RepID=A0ABY7VQ33_9BACT|nr:FAD-dependent oxidoreductase [Lentisphaera profundi]WDE96285.1 FAD-dependent oxidoreductase [Lentisphaera profundi]